MANNNVVCRSCGNVGKQKKITPGSLILEIVLWFCALVPGLIYSIYRHTKRHQACGACGSAEIIPADTPVGRKLVAEFNAT